MADRPSEYGLAAQLAHELQGEYAWVPETRQGYSWGGGRWQEDRAGGWITERAHQALQRLEMRAERRRLDAVIDLLRRREEVLAPAETWDARPWILQTPAGVVDLTTGALRPAVPEDYCVKCTAVAAAPDSGQAWWDHLRWMMPGQLDMACWLLEYLGYALTGCRRDQSLVVLHGNGSNGKSVLMDSVMTVLGDYATKSPEGLLTSGDGAVRPDAVAAVQGCRLVIADESERGHQLNEGAVKALTGSACISARQLFGKFYAYRQTAVYVVMTNHRPVCRGTDDGLWRRVRLVPCLAKADPEDKRLLERLIEQDGPGILAFLIAAAGAYYRDGLSPVPATVAAATRQYRSSSDALGTWLAEETVADPESMVGAKTLYRAYNRWADQQGLRPDPGPALRDALTDRGWILTRKSQGMMWLGLRLETRAEEEEDG